MGFKVLIPQDITAAGKEWLVSKGYEVTVLADSSPEAIGSVIKDYDAVLARTADYPREVLEKGKKLKVIARYGAGVDNIDCQAATELGIWVCNAPVANSASVAEHTIALLLACAKNLVVQDKQARAGNYDFRNQLKGCEVQGKTLGLVGCGHIGRLVAKKAHFGLEMNVIAYDAYLEPEQAPEYVHMEQDVDTVLAKSDFISLHIPATKETAGFINAARLRKMKRTAVLLNCARGGVVEEEDLHEALKNHMIAGAGLDVFEKEPPDAKNPLFSLEQVVVSPHNAALTVEAMDRMGLHAARGIDEVLRGERPTWPVNKL
jgi:D-3-phosphoglycerate dehydrogenase